MKIMIVSIVFMIIISGLLALQIKTAYLYQTAQMIYQAQKQQLLYDTMISYGLAKIKRMAEKSIQENVHFDFSDSIAGLSGELKIELLEAKGTVRASLSQDKRVIMEHAYVLHKELKGSLRHIYIDGKIS